MRAAGLRMRVGVLAVVLCASMPVTLAGAQRTKPAQHRTPSRLTVRDETFHSTSLGRDMKYRVILPADYDRSERRYPILYLLHGATGAYTDWETRTGIAGYVRDLPLIIAMPDADDSWYTNSATLPQDRFEDYIIKDVVNEIETKFRVIRAPYARAIAGLSMGGYGAMKFALKYPQMFVFAASFSGAFQVPAHVADWPNRTFEKDWLRVFGRPEDAVRDDNDDIFKLAAKASASAMPYIWFSCGTDDRLLEINRQLARVLKERGIAYEYHETPGAHTWDFWNQQLKAVWPVLTEHLKLQCVPNPAAVHDFRR